MVRTGRPRKDPREPAEIMRAAGLEPLAPYPGSGLPWLCRHVACGREVTPRLSNVTKGQRGCIHCSGRARIEPEAAAAVMRAAGLEPLESYPGSDRHWRCRHVACGREVTPTYVRINSGAGACRWCAPNAPVDPDAAAADMRAAGLEPLAPYQGVDTPWPVRCLTCGTCGTPTLGSIRGGQGGCRPCGRRKADAAMRNDAEAASAVMRAAGFEPLEPYPGTAFAWKSRCTRCGTIVSPRLGSLAGRSRPGCKPCADRANGIAQRHDEGLAVAEIREHGFEPQEPYRGVKYPWRCLCRSCGTITSPTFGSILAGQSGCRRCADLRAAAARREDPERAAVSMRESGLEPLEPYTTSMAPWRCRCITCGRTSTPTLAKVRSGRGCKYCARHGFDRAAPARVYVVTHDRHHAVKIGVAGARRRNDRIAQHARFGWALFYERYVPTGDDALAVEQAILRRLRAAGHGVFLTAVQLPNGWTETFDAQRVSAAELRAAIREEHPAVPSPTEPPTLF
ncbi:GIY-YIG nuclease family protein [Embleya sp. NPDC008237]|uniref:GIY-YIG nuclease family protein n=1 Tax=Embleya sp. NPDC008237 TaxID=3363978 RepID=UPI0036E95607